MAEKQQVSSTALTLENAEDDLPSRILSILQAWCLPAPLAKLNSPLPESLKAFFKLVLPAPPCTKCGERTFFRYFNNTTKTKQLQPRFQCAICALKNNSKSSKGHYAEFTLNQAAFLEIMKENNLDIHTVIRSAIVSAPHAPSYVRHHVTSPASSQSTSSTKESSAKKRGRGKDDYIPPPAVPLQKQCVAVNDQQNCPTSDDYVPAPAMRLEKQRTAMNDQRSNTPTPDVPMQKQTIATKHQENAAPTPDYIPAPAIPLRKQSTVMNDLRSNTPTPGVPIQKQSIAANHQKSAAPTPAVSLRKKQYIAMNYQANDQQNTSAPAASLQKQCAWNANNGEEYNDSYRFGNIIVRHQGASIELLATSPQIGADELEDRRNRGVSVKLRPTDPHIDTNVPKDRGTNEPKDRGTNLPKDTGTNEPKDRWTHPRPQYIMRKPRMQADELEDTEIRGASLKLCATDPQMNTYERDDRGIRPQFILKKPHMKSGNVISLEICIAGLTRDS